MSSVRPSVTLVDQGHTGWKSWKLIAGTISPTPSLFVAQRPSTYSQGNMGKFWGDYREVGKSGVLEHKSGNVSKTRKDRRKVTMEGLEELTKTLSNGTIPDALRRPLPQDWGSQPQSKTAIAVISRTGKAMDCKFGRYIRRVYPNKSP